VYSGICPVGLDFFLSREGAKHLLGPENPPETKDFTAPGGLSPHSPSLLNTPLILMLSWQLLVTSYYLTTKLAFKSYQQRRLEELFTKKIVRATGKRYVSYSPKMMELLTKNVRVTFFLSSRKRAIFSLGMKGLNIFSLSAQKGNIIIFYLSTWKG